MTYPAIFATPGVKSFAEEIDTERQRQLAKFGEQHHPDGTGLPVYQHSARRYRDHADRAAASGHLAWRDVLMEEVYEALAEDDPAKLRTELLQVAAVCAAWIADIDSRTSADHVCNSVMALGEMNEPLGYLICGVCGTPKGGAQR
ncbi:hypothetical protein AB9Q10_16310 [Streptomyces krungchingensis]|uniref:hypothetical protein n=1 Tax=Streptomyces krungchingensis TaxID=1565034 RepID=UPI003CF21D46